MSKYTCEKCGKEFKQKGHYTSHLNKKNPCVNELKIKEIVDKAVEEKLSNIIIKPAIELIIIDDHNEKTSKNEHECAENSKSSSQTPLKFVDLFCGIGSFHYSFNKFGWKCVMSCDIDNAVKQTYKENYDTLLVKVLLLYIC